jgi:hypothetical protein
MRKNSMVNRKEGETMKIVAVCHDCKRRNKQLLGTERFEIIQSVFEFISDAISHSHTYPEHQMILVIKMEENDEQKNDKTILVQPTE